MARAAYAVTRRSTALALVAAATFAVTAAQAHGRADAGPTAHAASHPQATVLRRSVADSGRYRLVVSLRARSESSERVTVHVSGQRARTTLAGHISPARLTYQLKLTRTKRLTIDAVADRPGVRMSLSMDIERPAQPARPATTTRSSTSGGTPSSGATGATAATGATVTSGTTAGAGGSAGSSVGTAGSGAGSGAGASSFTNPYTNLVWSDVFTQDYATANASNHTTTEPLGDASNAWGLDNWGGCGASESVTATGASAASTAYLTANGLVLPAVQTGSTSYSTAQVDTASGSDPYYATVGSTIEASITLPTGQGLCPAFWLVTNNGSGEIDVLEAPSFVGSQWGPSAPYSIFTLHANGVQQWEAAVTPSAWDATATNVYGIVWSSSSITWTVNGVPYATATAASLDDPALWAALTTGNFSLVFDEAVGGWPGDPAANTSYAAAQPMVVQWVKVFN